MGKMTDQGNDDRSVVRNRILELSVTSGIRC